MKYVKKFRYCLHTLNPFRNGRASAMPFYDIIFLYIYIYIYVFLLSKIILTNFFEYISVYFGFYDILILIIN